MFIQGNRLHRSVFHTDHPVRHGGQGAIVGNNDHGHTGSYTLVTPQGKLYFAQLREMILLVS